MLEKTLESPLDCKEIQPVHSNGDQPWVFFGRNDAKAETPVLWPPHWKRLWCWEGLGAEGEGDDRGWDGWMASLTRWTWVWVNSGSWWWTGRPGVLWFMGSQRVGHDWATDVIWSDNFISPLSVISKGKEKANKSSKRVIRGEPGKEVWWWPPLKPRERKFPSELSAHTVGGFLPGGGLSWTPKQWFSDSVHTVLTG